MNNSVFGKPMGNVRKHRDIKLVTTNSRISHLVSEPNYHTTKWFSENLNRNGKRNEDRSKNGQIGTFRSIDSRHQ